MPTRAADPDFVHAQEHPTDPRPELPDLALSLRGLTKRYAEGENRRPALDAVDLDVPRGAVFGLLGPNGAGKSTLINILAGLVVKSAGTARIWGIDIDAEPRSSRSAIGVVPQELNIDAFFTPREILDVQAGLYGVPRRERRTDELLEQVGLADKARAPARTLSGGMRRRLMVAKAMVHAPPVLVLDEPTAGVDVALRQQLWDHVRRLNRAGTTIVLTTHYLEEAQALCERIAILDRGTIVAVDTTAGLLARVDDKEVTVTLAEELAVLPPELARLGAELTGPARLRLHYQPSRAALGSFFAAIAAAALTIRDVSTREADLEDIFLQLTNPANAGASAGMAGEMAAARTRERA